MQPIAASCEARPSKSQPASFVQNRGSPMARKHRFRFDFRGVFAGRPLVLRGRRWRTANSVCCGRRFGALGSMLLLHQPRGTSRWSEAYPMTIAAKCGPPSDSKSPQPVSRRGLNSFDDVHMQVICPTCQILFRDRSKRRTQHLPKRQTAIRIRMRTPDDRENTRCKNQ
jgi:hypothetical protein